MTSEINKPAGFKPLGRVYLFYMLGIIGFTLHTLGEIMVGFTAIMVHHRVWKEHKIDKRVFAEMNKERKIGIIGLILIVAGFAIELVFRTMS